MAPIDYRWAHGVNTIESLKEIKQAIENNLQIIPPTFPNAIEADIIFCSMQKIAVMGHPPQTTSDLSLSNFLKTMHSIANFMHQQISTTNAQESPPLIVKLDFKSMKAFHSAYFDVQTFITQFPFYSSVFINADILEGPTSAPCLQFDAKEFLEKSFALAQGMDQKKVILSVGWTTSNSNDEEIYRPYTMKMINDMLDILQPYLNKIAITFPLRATSCRMSWDVIEQLLLASPSNGFTLWWAKTQMTDEEIDWIFSALEESKEMYKGRTFYDILGFRDFYTRKKCIVDADNK